MAVATYVAVIINTEHDTLCRTHPSYSYPCHQALRYSSKQKLERSFTISRPAERKSLIDFSPKLRLSNFRNLTCQATLSFQNDTFLPLSALASPMNCPGDQIAKLQIPESVPNGPAALEWQCSGANGVAVDLMIISGGLGDWELFTEESEAVRIAVQCHENATDQSHNNVTCR
ncbi:hypothetical protein EJ07DRAFT_159277 [Lizonia empirigonia]|nr:hypothetical protein EJ07DRAFT_159277 [Lizonia empirigonia]